MKTILPTVSRLAAIAILALCSMFLVPKNARANDYLEQKKHYSIYASGMNKVHFVIPVWAYGASYDYYAYDEDGKCSYIAYKKDGDSNWTTIAYYKTDAYDENEKNNDKGTAYVRLLSGQGDIVVTSMTNGVNYQIHDKGAWSNKLYVTQKEHDGYSQVTFLEFDWYAPESLDSLKYSLKIQSEFQRSYTHGNKLSTTVEEPGFVGSNNTIRPQLYTPYLYTLNEKGVAGYGYAAVPYMVFQEPVSYYTSFNPTEVVDKDVERAGTIYVPTTDTVQQQMTATFKLVREDATGSTVEQKSTAVDIPPYHRIYDFAVREETDSTGTFTGNNILTWYIKNPQVKDLMDNDFFEIQRSLESDFSDAQTLSVIQMIRNEEKTDYVFSDNGRETWTGNAGSRDNEIEMHMKARDNHYVIIDDEGEPLAEIDASLSADSVILPGVPVYYRIRRASSSVWGWEHDFAKKASMVRHNYLAPLASMQSPYSLDDDFTDNRKVHFTFHIENSEVRERKINIDSCTFTYSLNKILKLGSASLHILFEQGQFCNNPEGKTAFRVIDNEGIVVQDWSYLRSGVYKYPIGSTLQVKNTDPDIYNDGVKTFTLAADSKIQCATEWRMAVQEFFAYFTQDGDGMHDFTKNLQRYLPAVKDSLYKVLQRENTISYGRCMWDRTAQLILQRTIEETGQTMEFIIPQDSIKRQKDGSWIAYYTDIADQGCSHYKYAVRIDQSRADLHVQDSASLKPIQISGPSLYIDEAAKITSFEATQGDATTDMKSGVLLRWVASSNAVDKYVLLRRPKDSDVAADTIYQGNDYYYLDRSAMPNTNYEYTIEAHYTCNGKTTVNTSTAEGWRTPYGEISGTILMPDNTGMAGVKVALQDGNNNVIRTITTNASGEYKFDSLEYIAIECEKPKVKITYSYDFSIWAPERQTLFRVLNADGNVLEDWHNKNEGIYEYPIGTVLEVKSILTEVGDAISSFTVNRHVTLDCFYGRQKSGANYKYSFKVTASEQTECKCKEVSQSNYIVMPTHQYGIFSFNSTSAGTASITLSQNSSVASGIDFMNTSTTRLTGRVLYKNSSIPVSGVMFLLNGDTVRRGNMPLKSGIDGNFELILPLRQPCRLQVFKQGHIFEGDGILRLEEDKEEFALDKPQDGVRFYDMTKVRLVGRVAGGNDQRDLPRAFGLGKNNLGDNVQLVLQLEGDNTAHIVYDPNDLTRDTIQQTIPHVVYSTDPLAAVKERTVGTTRTLFEKKRITIHPDSATGEFAVDLFPVKYKVVQATATGYATLFGSGQGSETFDLTNAPLTEYVGRCNMTAKEITVERKDIVSEQGSTTKYPYSGGIASQGGLLDGDSIHYNAVYDRIYHSPVIVTLKQVLYGLDKAGYGEEEMDVNSLSLHSKQKVRLYEKHNDGSVTYLLGHPVFVANRKYQFIARAFERYYYNNNLQSSEVDEVPQRGGSVRIHNGLKSATTYQDYTLDDKGQNKSVMLEVADIDTENSGENALRTVSTVLQVDDNYVETDVFQAFVSGTDIQIGEMTSTPSGVVLLDIVRDPGGNGSSAWVESGTTYNFAYTDSYDWKIGVELTPKYGVSISQDIGAISAPEGFGTYLGANYETGRQLSFTLPITHEWKWGYKYNYTFTTTDRISTSSGKTKDNVGRNADVFLGTTVSQLAGKAKTVDIINDSMFIARQPAINAGMMKVLAQGTDSVGKQYYLVTGQKVVFGSHVEGSFVYTQYYILNTLIPKLALERQNLLMNFPDSAAAQDYADQTGEAVYWYHSTGENVSLIDTLPYNTYEMFVPKKSSRAFTNRVAALDNMILQWITILYQNEKEKVIARMIGSQVGTWSVSSGATISHTDNYTASAQYNEMPQGWALVGSNAASNSAKVGQSLLKEMRNIVEFFMTKGQDQIGTTVGDAITQLLSQHAGKNKDEAEQKKMADMGTKTNESKLSFQYNPIFSYDNNSNASQEQTVKKSSGFTLGADTHGDITVSVYRAQYDSVWDNRTQSIRDKVNQNGYTDYLYGSYVFYTVAGSSYCPHEEEEKTLFYNKGMILNNETQWVDKPEMSIDTHEQTGVHPDKRATFRVTLMNNGQVQTGLGANGTLFNLALWADSNPDGAKVYVDGAPLITAIPVFLVPGQPVVKTIEVERGTVDDYNNLTLALSLADCPKTNSKLNFSVHFLPVSSDVSISMPRQNWIMNTLSQHDSVGYYLPVEIDGFDIHHKNFDHIEFQYKLSTESEEMWVNQCSFYASDSLYGLATGNKAMIQNGRIVPFRFYGERDPMEQRYDLRAVTFCRFGSGFVTKSSPVISGTKDTRPPQVFGAPEPANAILGVGDNLRLRFNEPIAGNYLDEDNNFQIVGVTNETGITTSASLHFDGTPNSYAATQVSRTLEARSYSIDMVVKPTTPTSECVFFEHGLNREGVVFGKTADDRLYLQFGTYTILSLPLPKQMLDFTRVVATYNYSNNTLRFYAGTKDITDYNANPVPDVPYTLNAPLMFGRGMEGNMLEVRVWTKPLTQEEVIATNLRYLTGYEQELAAYYRMNEGTGTTVKDYASGATLTTHGTSWNLPKGISLSISKNDSVTLAQDKLSRSAIYDATYMLWFRNTNADGVVFRAGEKRFAVSNGNLQWWLNDSTMHPLGAVGTDEWHHLVLTINRTYNNVAIYVDNKLLDTYPATQMTGMTGDMFFGGDGFEGNIDEFVVFEQALPKTLIEEYGNRTPRGDEMGLIAYLPFEELKQNDNGALELVFSANDRRVFRDDYGNTVNKIVPLLIESTQPTLVNHADKTIFAPVYGFGLLTKLNFGWAFNGDELLINLKMADYEINKQTVCVTVRDVEDLNGNPMPSPVMWVAYVDRNALKWDSRQVNYEATFDDAIEREFIDVSFTNQSGRRHQYKIESLPDWLSISEPSGSVGPVEFKQIRLNFDHSLAVGSYTDLIYLTDENGLSEPLRVNYTVKAVCPWQEPATGDYPLNMSVCGQVLINDDYDTDTEDKLIALYRNECVGMANIDFDNITNKSRVFLTVYGNEQMNKKTIQFQLWQASTGKVLTLTPSVDITFAHGAVYGCGNEQQVIFTAGGSEVQNIFLQPGWNWTSFNIGVYANQTGVINNVMSASAPWIEGDLIKNPVTRNFCVYSDSLGQFSGSLYHFRYIYTHMVYSKNGNIMRVSGNVLPQDSMHVTLRGNGQWSPLPCLFSEATPVAEALADYFDNATVGDMVKAHNRFAYFSENKRWEGNLTALHPGEGYFFRRLGQGDVVVSFYDNSQKSAVHAQSAAARSAAAHSTAAAPRSAAAVEGLPYMADNTGSFSNPNAATNMTMIATVEQSFAAVEGQTYMADNAPVIRVYAGDELAAVAQPQQIDGKTYYLLTIQSDNSNATLRFETEDGTELRLVNESTSQLIDLTNQPDAHFGSLRAPMRLVPITEDSDRVYKILENGHVIIIRGSERYDVTGRRLNK